MTNQPTIEVWSYEGPDGTTGSETWTTPDLLDATVQEWIDQAEREGYGIEIYWTEHAEGCHDGLLGCHCEQMKTDHRPQAIYYPPGEEPAH